MAHLKNRTDFETVAPIVSTNEAAYWSCVDDWLASLFPGRQPPPYEKNADTLRALSALRTSSDAASGQARLLARVDREALEEAADHAVSSAPTMTTMREALLEIIEQALPEEGRIALNSLAAVAVAARVALPEPEQLGASVIECQSAVSELEAMMARTSALEQQLEAEASHIAEVLAISKSESYSLPDGLHKRNAELQRTVDAMTARIPEFEQKIASLPTAPASLELTVHDIIQEEQEYIALAGRKMELEKRISVFRGLPSDPNQARDELNAYRKELQAITSRRDAAFQGLVERETPTKGS